MNTMGVIVRVFNLIRKAIASLYFWTVFLFILYIFFSGVRLLLKLYGENLLFYILFFGLSPFFIFLAYLFSLSLSVPLLRFLFIDRYFTLRRIVREYRREGK